MMELFLSAFVTLFVVIDPPGCAPIYAGLTASASPAARRSMALRACLIAGVILVGFALFGQDLLGAMHIELDAFRIAGGIMLFLIALEMLFEKRTERRAKSADESHATEPAHDPTVFPLATPLIAGPGAMASMILLTAKADSYAAKGVVFLCLAAVLLCCLALFMAAGLLERALGPTGIKLVSRLLGVLLGALAVQFVLDGLADYGFVG